MRITLPFGPHHQRNTDHENKRHGPEQGTPLTAIVDHVAKGKAERGGDQENRQHLHKIGQGGRVFERVRRVGIEEAATVRSEHFDGFLRRHWPHRQELFCPFQRGIRCVRQQVLQAALLYEEQRDQQRNRQQDPQRNARQVYPCVTQRAHFLARKRPR